jgi:hypothetical protein
MERFECSMSIQEDGGPKLPKLLGACSQIKLKEGLVPDAWPDNEEQIKADRGN